MKCVFCNSDIKKGEGFAFIKKDGTIFYFCSGKCKSYFDKKRKREKYKWATRK